MEVVSRPSFSLPPPVEIINERGSQRENERGRENCDLAPLRLNLSGRIVIYFMPFIFEFKFDFECASQPSHVCVCVSVCVCVCFCLSSPRFD